ncbi:hypothetical protein ABZ499_01845 [Streptomyces sp. NPDC019990]|uniref:hypothetical protein n=1 Tax=Streptomyces sp. NPDC019990 TaxID=3154693 RepID=UPI003407E78D
MRQRKGRVRGLIAGAGALTAALALLVGGASPASAGGPTSVLVVSPASAEAAALYYDDEEYRQLEQLLGHVRAGGRMEPPEADLSSARRFTVTWMAHDISPWRVDQIFFASKGEETWIHTAAKQPGARNGCWHRAERPDELRALLEELGVKGRPADGTGIIDVMSAPWGTAEPEAASPKPEPATARAEAPRADDGTDWWWVLPGAAGGAVLALASRPFAQRVPFPRRKRAGEAEQELLDG